MPNATGGGASHRSYLLTIRDLRSCKVMPAKASQPWDRGSSSWIGHGSAMDQSVLNGLISGLTLAILSLAFAVVYVSTNVFHIMLAGIFALAPYVVWTLMDLGIVPGVFAAIVWGIGISIAVERANHAPLFARSASSGAHLISSLGAYMVTVQAIALIWGDEGKMLRTGIDERLEFFGQGLTTTQCWSAGISLASIATFFIWLFRSRSGLLFRAVADNQTEFELRGFSVTRIRMLAFALSGTLCVIASLLEAFEYGFNAHGGLHALLPAMVAVMLVGPTSFFGVVVTSLTIGVGREVVTWSLSAAWADALVFGVLAIVLFVRHALHGLSYGCGR